MEKVKEEVLQDEIWEYNEEKGENQLIAYWDDELEYYIYLKEEVVLED